MIDTYDDGADTEEHDIDAVGVEEDVAPDGGEADVDPEGEGAAPEPEDQPERPKSDIARLRQRRREAENRAKAAEQRAADLERILSRLPRQDGEEEGMTAAEQLDRRLSEIEERERAAREEEQSRQVVTAYVRDLRADYDDFAIDVPDVYDAGQYLGETMRRSLSGLGYSDAEIAQEIATREYKIAEAARADGLNPGEAIYAAARKAGYKTKAEAASETRRERAATKGRGISSGGGGGTSGKLTKAKVLAEFRSGDPERKAKVSKYLDDDAFAKLPD